MNNKKVAVLLSSYNGEKYIKEQIDSIINQTYKNIEIFVRDDGSKDRTVEILKEYETDKKIKLITGKNLGFVNSFFELLKHPKDAEYFAFADQDDIWMENKIEKAVEMLGKEENNNIPIMYYSNYDFYDENMNFKSNAKDRSKTSFLGCLVECVNSGMATVINKKARDIIINKLPQNCCSHDWWIYMIYQGLGKVIYDEKVMVKHRTHGNNTSECGKSFIGLQIFRIKSLFKSNFFKKIRYQIQDYKEYFYEVLSDENKKIINLFYPSGLKIGKQIKKLFYPKRFRNLISDEIIIRIMFLIGVI